MPPAVGRPTAQDPALLAHIVPDLPWPGRGLAWTTVAVLQLAYVFAFVDRQILTLLVAPIRRDLQISDTQISLLMGASFAIFYTLFGIPLGRLADRGSRRRLIAAGMVLWSLATSASAFARRFAELLLCRVGVGIGEAALSPAAYSWIADSFPPQVRARAISVYSMGIYIGSGLALVAGGVVVGFASAQDAVTLPLLGALQPWQVVFLVVGLPGLLAALLVACLREPARRGVGVAAGADGARAAAAPLRETLAWFRRNRATFLCHNLGFALLALAGYADNLWIPTFLIRRHGWSTAEAGVVFGAIVATCGTAGVLTGGWACDRLLARGRTDAPLRVGVFACAACLPFSALYPLVPGANASVALAAVTIFLIALPFGVAPAGIQEVVPARMRGQASALYLFVVNLVGLGLGPTAVALLTDHVFHDDHAIHLSLLLVGTLAQACALLLLQAGLRPYRESLQRLAA